MYLILYSALYDPWIKNLESNIYSYFKRAFNYVGLPVSHAYVHAT